MAAALAGSCRTLGSTFVSQPSAKRDLSKPQPQHGPDAVDPSVKSGGHVGNLSGVSTGAAGMLMLLGAGAGGGAAMRTNARRQETKPRAAISPVATFTDLSIEQSEAGSQEWLPRALLMMFAVFCSTNFTLVKVLEQEHSEAAVAAVRFTVALIPFLPMIQKHSSKQSVVAGTEIGLWCTLGYLCQALGLPHTDASKGAFLCSLTMLVVPLVKSVFGAKIPMQVWAAAMLALGGTGLLLGIGADGNGLLSGMGWGELVCSGTALGFGLMFVRMDEYAKEPNFDAMGCTIWQVVTLAACMVTWLLVQSGPIEASHEVASLLFSGPEVLATLFWVGIITTAGVLYVETWAMERVDSTEAGIIFASEPVWATMFASVVLGESFGLKEGLGGALIVLACLLTQVKFDGVNSAASTARESNVVSV